MRNQDRALKDFIAEAEELLDQLSADIKVLEEKAGKVHPQLINQIFRNMHSLKGLSSMLNFTHLAELAHTLEDLLDKLRMGKVKVNPTFIDLLYDALTVLQEMVVQIAEGGSDELSTHHLLKRAQEFLAGSRPKQEESLLDLLDLDESVRKSLTEYEEHRLKDNLVQNANVFALDVQYPFEVFDKELRKLSEMLNQQGEVISTLPSGTSSPDEIAFRLLYATQKPIEEIQALVSPFPVVNIKREEPVPEPEEGIKPTLPTRSISQTVRVDIAKLDLVMNIVGELVLEKNNLEAIASALEAHGLPMLLLQRLNTVHRSLERKLEDLQKGMIDLRMVPIGQIFNKVNRIVRQLAQDFGKEVVLQMKGEDTELDKMIIEAMTDPLIHIIRNAVDHGIEPPAERAKKGKPAKGAILLEATQKGNSVVIRVQDDGKGLDLQKIARIARKKGLLSEDELTEERLLNIIFTPGFSSAEEISQVSGRGVGLDVVKENISKLNGSIFVSTQKDQGTTFEIILPITLAIIQCLIVSVEDQLFATPLTSIAEVLRVQSSEIQWVEGKEVYYLRDFTLPLIRLSSLFSIPTQEEKPWVFVVVAQLGDRRVGMIVDRLHRQQEVVIKSIGSRLKNIPGIAGAAELESGSLVLVLDVASIMDQALQYHGTLRTSAYVS